MADHRDEVPSATDFDKADVEYKEMTRIATNDGDEAPEAQGVNFETIDPKYWRSFRFLGSVASIILITISLYIGFALPASCLQVINEDLGTACNQRANYNSW